VDRLRAGAPSADPPLHLWLWPGGDLAGLFIVAMIALSAGLAGFESIRRLIDPQPITNVGVVLAAGILGFIGNEAVAVYRIRVGRKIGSAALVADGLHARTDGFTSLAVAAGALGVMAGFPLADTIVGLLITIAILFVLRGAAREIYRRLMDAVEPELVDAAEAVLRGARDSGVDSLRLRWLGHRLRAETDVTVETHSASPKVTPSPSRHSIGSSTRFRGSTPPPCTSILPRATDVTLTNSSPIISDEHPRQLNPRPDQGTLPQSQDSPQHRGVDGIANTWAVWPATTPKGNARTHGSPARRRAHGGLRGPSGAKPAFSDHGRWCACPNRWVQIDGVGRAGRGRVAARIARWPT
jgi:hypothetical protein